MVHTASLLNSKSEFDSFLFAPVGEDKRGTVVSVLTAFARLDFDPWQQAADFARLPREKAKAKLAAMITTLPGMSPSHAEPATVAAGLLALLPAPPHPAVASPANWLGATQPASFRSPRYILSIAVFMVLGLASQFFLASQQPPAANTSPAQTTVTTGAQSRAGGLVGAVSATGSASAEIKTGDGTGRDVIDLHGDASQIPGGGEPTLATRPPAKMTPARKPLFGK